MSATHDNGYQMFAAGLDSYQSGLAQLFSKKFPHATNCSMTATQLRRSEPKPRTGLCHLGVSLLPWSDGTEPLLQSYNHVFVPPVELVKIISWAMDSHTAAKVYYDVDLRLVPLTGDASANYLVHSFKTGPDWRLNGAALGQ